MVLLYFLLEMKYKKIVKVDTDTSVQHSTIRGLKLAMRQGKIKEGIFHGFCPNGNIHQWEVKTSGVHTCAGSTGSKGKIGKGLTKNNYTAKLVKVIAA